MCELHRRVANAARSAKRQHDSPGSGDCDGFGITALFGHRQEAVASLQRRDARPACTDNAGSGGRNSGMAYAARLSAQGVLAGLVERVTFHNAENDRECRVMPDIS